MKNIFSDEYSARKTLREIKILRKLSQIPNNLFSTKLHDLILPTDLEKKEGFLPSIKEEEKMPFDFNNKKTHYEYNPHEQVEEEKKINLSGFNHIFLVMELVDSDMKKLLSSKP